MGDKGLKRLSGAAEILREAGHDTWLVPTQGPGTAGAKMCIRDRRLEKAIGSTAGFWLRLQLNYDLAQVQARSGRIHARRLGTPAQLSL